MARRSGVRIFGPYRGGVLHYRYEAAWILAAWAGIAGFFWFTHGDQLWLEGWWLFWHIPEKAVWGALIALAPFVIVWVAIPLGIATIGRGAEGYVRYPSEDRLRWALLTWLTCMTCAISIVIAPAATIELYRSGLRPIIKWGASVLATVSGITLILRFVRALLRKGSKEGRDVRQFPDEMRPLNTRVVNLDVGALAPTLDVVARGLNVWARVVGGSAPTSMRLWRAVTDPRASLPEPWQHNLKGLAWRTVEDFRSAVAELVGAHREAVVFLTSTTRALDAVLETSSYDAIVSTNCEHSSEDLLFSAQEQKRHIPLVKVDLLALMAGGAVYTEFVSQVKAKCNEFQRPLVVVSEVPFCYGIRLPVPELAHELRSVTPGAVIVVDGAHVVGHCPVNLGDCDFDYYVFSGHKWLYGPPSLGILVLGKSPNSDREILDGLRAECYESLAFAGSRLGEAGATIALEPFVGLAEFLGRLLPGEARMEVFQNIRAIRRYFEASIQKARSVRVVAYPGVPADCLAPGIVNVQGKRGDLGLTSLATVRDALEDKHRIVAKLIERPTSVRLCLPFYLTLREVERVVQALDDSFAAVGG